jgi:hypothetical protein
VRTSKQNFWLFSGVASLALCIGYMVAASDTSIASVAVPAVFGLIVTAFGLVSGATAEKKLEEVKEIVSNLNDKVAGETVAALQTSLIAFRSDLGKVSESVGKLLIVFTLFYAIGLLVGAQVRIRRLLSPDMNARLLPWHNTAAPPTTAEAMDWISVQEQLLAMGYSRQQIADLYQIQIKEWAKTTEIKENPQNPGRGEETKTPPNVDGAAKEQSPERNGSQKSLAARLVPGTDASDRMQRMRRPLYESPTPTPSASPTLTPCPSPSSSPG